MVAKRFGRPDEWTASIAPGRVNLIGEHTDYNDGFVLPMAIERHVAVAFRRGREGEVRVWSEYFDEEVRFDVQDLAPGRVSGWGAYPAGMCWAMRERGLPPVGMDAVVVADIPIGAGVSSSAAIEVSFGLALSELNGFGLSRRDIAELAHVADNEFVGIPSGIMDQFASAMCTEGHALLIDCRNREAQSVSIRDDMVFIVMDTGKRRGLVDSEYADRVAACRRVADAVGRFHSEVTALRDVTIDHLDDLRAAVDPSDRRRAMHVIAENERTLEAVEALEAGDAARFGSLMVDSHVSLRDLYEVSCRELDIAVDLALEHDACLGARMTGGGFGGCALALVRTAGAGAFVDWIPGEYARSAGRDGNFFSVRPSAGVERANLHASTP